MLRVLAVPRVAAVIARGSVLEMAIVPSKPAAR